MNYLIPIVIFAALIPFNIWATRNPERFATFRPKILYAMGALFAVLAFLEQHEVTLVCSLLFALAAADESRRMRARKPITPD
jgi:Mg2+/Co2+ transporter CorB